MTPELVAAIAGLSPELRAAFSAAHRGWAKRRAPWLLKGWVA